MSRRARLLFALAALSAAVLGPAALEAQQSASSALRIPPTPASGPAPRYLDEMRTVIDARGGDSSNGHRYGLYVWGWVYGHGVTTQDAMRIEARMGDRSVASARCRIETEPDRSSLAAIGSYTAGYFACETEKTIEQLGELSVRFTFVDDATDREVPLRTMNVRVGAGYNWDGEGGHIGIPFAYAPDRMGGSALWIRLPPFGEEAVFFTFWGSPTRAGSRASNDDLQLRCTHDGQRIESAQAIGRMLHQIGGNTASHQLRSQDEDQYGMSYFQLRTNFAYRGVGGQRPDAWDLAAHPGQYACQLRYRGDAVRELRFAVAPNGEIVPHPEQSGASPLVLTPGMTLIDTRFPNPTAWDRGLSASAIRTGSFAGRAWQSPASVAEMLGALPAADAGELEPSVPPGRIAGPARAAAPRAAAAAGRGRRR